MANEILSNEDRLALESLDDFLGKVRERVTYRVNRRDYAGMDNEDVVQEAMFRVYKAMPSYDSTKGKFSPFVDRIVDCTIIDCIRKAGSRSSLMIANAVELVDTFVEEAEEDTKDMVQVGQEDLGYNNVEFLTDTMTNMGLNDREKEIFRLRSAGYEFKEIADIMGVSKARMSQLWNGIIKKYKAMD